MLRRAQQLSAAQEPAVADTPSEAQEAMEASQGAAASSGQNHQPEGEPPAQQAELEFPIQLGDAEEALLIWDSLVWVASLSPTALVHLRVIKGGHATPACRWKQATSRFRGATQEFPGLEGARNSGRATCANCLAKLPKQIRDKVEATFRS